MRRVLWNIYAWPITFFLVLAVVSSIASRISLLTVLDAAISLPSLVALHLHIWDKKCLSASFWKPYAFVFPLWDCLCNLLVEPMSSGKRFNPLLLIVPVILLPLYVGVFRYAFRKWEADGFSDGQSRIWPS